jgi:hypothetical protein
VTGFVLVGKLEETLVVVVAVVVVKKAKAF